MRVKENLPIMVLVKESSNKLLFRFNSALWGCLAFLIGIILGIATYFAFADNSNNWMAASIFSLFALIFLYSSIYSFNLRRALEIDELKHVVNYVESSLYNNIKWQKEFQNFENIKAFRANTIAGSSGAKRAKNWSIQLISKEGDIFAIGYSQFGAMNRQKAEELVTRVADMMEIRKDIIDD